LWRRAQTSRLAGPRALSSGIELKICDSEDEFHREVANTQVIYGGISVEDLKAAKHLKWVQYTAAGVEGILSPELVASPDLSPAALVFGPEDAGLSNAELDRCHRIVTVPTNPRYASLNLAQAVAVMAYELHVARGVAPPKRPRRTAPPATQEQLERLFGDAEQALTAIEFFKTRSPTAVMRTVRGVLHRTPLDLREAKLARAMCIEVRRYLERTGRSGGAS